MRDALSRLPEDSFLTPGTNFQERLGIAKGINTLASVVGMKPLVSEDEVAADLGFASLSEFRAWSDAGMPTGRCSNKACWRPAFFPNLDKPCKYCGSSIRTDVKGEHNP